MNDPISVSFYLILFYAMHFLKKKSIEKRIRSRSFNNYVDKMRAEGVKNGYFGLHSWYKNCPGKRGVVKKWQNSVHVVVK